MEKKVKKSVCVCVCVCVYVCVHMYICLPESLFYIAEIVTL